MERHRQRRRKLGLRDVSTTLNSDTVEILDQAVKVRKIAETRCALLARLVEFAINNGALEEPATSNQR